MRAYLPWYLVVGYLGAVWAAALGVLLLRWGGLRRSRGLQGVGALLLLGSGVGFLAGVPEIWTPGLAGTELAAISGLALLGAWGAFRGLAHLLLRSRKRTAGEPPRPTVLPDGADPNSAGQPRRRESPGWIRWVRWGFMAAAILALWRWDIPLFFAINRYAGRTPALDGLARLLINDYAVPTALALLAWSMWLSGDPKRQAAVLRAVVAVFLSGMILEISNALYVRPRPFTDYEVNLLFYHPSDSSFPSNAATITWAIAASLWTGDPRMGAIGIGLAAGISLARVYGGVHYPLDVAAGALLGAALGLGLHRSTRLRAWSLRAARRIGPWFHLPQDDD